MEVIVEFIVRNLTLILATVTVILLFSLGIILKVNKGLSEVLKEKSQEMNKIKDEIAWCDNYRNFMDNHICALLGLINGNNFDIELEELEEIYSHANVNQKLVASLLNARIKKDFAVIGESGIFAVNADPDVLIKYANALAEFLQKLDRLNNTKLMHEVKESVFTSFTRWHRSDTNDRILNEIFFQLFLIDAENYTRKKVMPIIKAIVPISLINNFFKGFEKGFFKNYIVENPLVEAEIMIFKHYLKEV